MEEVLAYARKSVSVTVDETTDDSENITKNIENEMDGSVMKMYLY